jgi:nitrite reductase/ring-hydroxylating ferredoxin subunit
VELAKPDAAEPDGGSAAAAQSAGTATLPPDQQPDAGPAQTAGFGLAAGWWPVAHAAEVTAAPRAVRLGSTAIVLCRDRADAAHALANLCPHRRLPLSMGRLTDNGLQCGYHGWTFDGVSGQCTMIPNVRPGEQPSQRIRVGAYPVAQAGGYVFVWTGAGPASPAQPAAAGFPPAAGRVVHGTVLVRAQHALVADALLLNPGAALGMGWLLGGGGEVFGCEVSPAHGAVTARRRRRTLDLPRISTYDPVSSHSTLAVITTQAATGLTEVTVGIPAGRGEVRVLIGLTPDGSHRTTVRWRVQAWGGGASAIRAALLARGITRPGARIARALASGADAAETAVDPALTRLRELRAPAAGGLA